MTALGWRPSCADRSRATRQAAVLVIRFPTARCWRRTSACQAAPDVLSWWGQLAPLQGQIHSRQMSASCQAKPSPFVASFADALPWWQLVAGCCPCKDHQPGRFRLKPCCCSCPADCSPWTQDQGTGPPPLGCLQFLFLCSLCMPALHSGAWGCPAGSRPGLPARLSSVPAVPAVQGNRLPCRLMPRAFNINPRVDQTAPSPRVLQNSRPRTLHPKP